MEIACAPPQLYIELDELLSKFLADRWQARIESPLLPVGKPAWIGSIPIFRNLDLDPGETCLIITIRKRGWDRLRRSGC